MKKKWIWISILFDIAFVSALFLYFTWESEEDRIKAEIEKANYCQVVEDCQMVAVSKCPFGCYVYVNQQEASRIEQMLNEYRSNCEYGCLEMKGVECRNTICQVISDELPASSDS